MALTDALLTFWSHFQAPMGKIYAWTWPSLHWQNSFLKRKIKEYLAAGTLQDLLGHFKTFWDLLGPSGTLLNLTEPYWTLLNLIGPYWTLLDLIEPHWTSKSTRFQKGWLLLRNIDLVLDLPEWSWTFLNNSWTFLNLPERLLNLPERFLTLPECFLDDSWTLLNLIESHRTL